MWTACFPGGALITWTMTFTTPSASTKVTSPVSLLPLLPSIAAFAVLPPAAAGAPIVAAGVAAFSGAEGFEASGAEGLEAPPVAGGDGLVASGSQATAKKTSEVTAPPARIFPKKRANETKEAMATPLLYIFRAPT